MDAALPVLVVGGGPVGLVAAALLDGYGVPTVVVEREREVHPLPRAANLDDDALRILQGLGVMDAIAGALHPVPGQQLVRAPGRVFWHFRDDPAPGPNGWPRTNLFRQPEVERALRARLTASPAARLLLGTELRTLRLDDGVVRAGIADTGGERVLEAAAVLGCDGARSSVRRLLGIGLRDRGFDQRWLVVDAEVDGPPLAVTVPQQVCDPGGPRTFVPMGGGRYRWEFLLPADGDEDAFLAAAPLAERVAPWTGGRPVRVLRRSAYRFHALTARRWRQGPAFLLGDAAHQMPPFLGQGLCAGLRDAANLSWKLALVREGVAGDALLDTYERERAAHVALVTTLSVLLGTAVAGRGPGGATLRGALRGARRLPAGLRRPLEQVETPGLRPGPLVRPRHRVAGRLRASGLLGRADAGFPFPQPHIDGVPLDDLLGGGFALVGLDRDPLAALTEPARQFWASLGTTALRATSDGPLAPWFRARRATVAVVRPDRYVLAIGEGAGLPTLEKLSQSTRAAIDGRSSE